MIIETVSAIRVVVRGAEGYADASKAAFGQAVESLGTGMLNLADCSKRIADGALMFTYTSMATDVDAGAYV